MELIVKGYESFKWQGGGRVCVYLCSSMISSGGGGMELV